jgi:hypothetical protein
LCDTSISCLCSSYTGVECTACVAASIPASTSPNECACGPGFYDASAV